MIDFFKNPILIIILVSFWGTYLTIITKKNGIKLVGTILLAIATGLTFQIEFRDSVELKKTTEQIKQSSKEGISDILDILNKKALNIEDVKIITDYLKNEEIDKQKHKVELERQSEKIKILEQKYSHIQQKLEENENKKLLLESKLDSNKIELHLTLAENYLKQKKYQKAIDQYNLYGQKDKNFLEEFPIAKIYFDQGKYDKVIEILENKVFLIFVNENGKFQYNYFLGLSYLYSRKNNNNKKAVEYLKNAEKHSNTFKIDEYLNLFYESPNYLKVINDFISKINNKKYFLDAYNELGKSYDEIIKAELNKLSNE